MGVIRWARRLLLLGLAIWLLTAVAVLAAMLLMQQRHGEGRSLAQPVDAAIVLGGGIDPDEVAGYSTRRRVAAAVRLLQTGAAERLIMSGGRIENSQATAAGLMRDQALALGVPPEAILVEDRSRTTFENLRFSFALAERAGLERLALVTDAFHLARAVALAGYFGRPEIGPVAAPGFLESSWHEIAAGIGREAMAWWYNAGKVGMWTLLGWLGMPVSERAEIVR